MNNRKTAVLADTICDLTIEMRKERNIITSPLTVVFGDEAHRDQIDISPDDVYEYYKKTGQLAKTTASNFQDHYDFFSENIKGYEGAVFFTISSEMSSNYNNARMAAAEFENVYVIDSRNLSTGIGLLVLEAADLADEGKSAKEIYDIITELAEHVDASFCIETLEFLSKGGRCSSVAALGANLLKLRPCIQVKNGKMDVCKKYRGKMNDVLKQYVSEKIADKDDIAGKRIFITHSGGCDEIALELKKQVSEVFPDKEILISRAGCTVCVHCGPGTLGILFIRKSKLQ